MREVVIIILVLDCKVLIFVLVLEEQSWTPGPGTCYSSRC